ncbi:MAG: hypothetical protein NT047_00790 [Deltaproteobacteria bacterium]|nr:hypothetical protein [Deltaproteobacteria bacterium]
MLDKRINPKTKRKEFALVSTDGRKVLQYFGKAKPSDEQIAAVESRVEHYANKGKG